MSDRERTRDLLARLQRHYIKPGANPPGGVFVPECGRNGSWGSGSRCDALYVGFTSASGRILIGHELKVSRADWRTELAKPGKADSWADACHAWYVVAPDVETVPIEELPAGWGLMVPGRSKTRMDIKVKAPVKVDHDPGWGAVRSIMARLDTLQSQAMFDFRQRVAEEERAAARKSYERQANQSLTPAQSARLSALDRLEERLGVSVDTWIGEDEGVRPEHLAAALRLMRGVDALPRDGRYLLPTVERHAKAVAEGVRGLAEASAAWRELIDGERSERAS